LQVGFLSGSIKAVTDARVGDTITLARNIAPAPLPGTYRVLGFVLFAAGNSGGRCDGGASWTRSGN
jgi:translation elongation factor EF-4